MLRKTINKSSVFLLVLVALLIYGCGPGQATEGVEPSAAATITPSEPTTTP